MIPYQPIPVLEVGSLKIGVAPLMSFVGFLVFGIFVAMSFRKQRIKFGINKFLVFMMLLVGSSILGGRVWHFVENWNGLSTIPVFLNVFAPGLTSYGMIIGGVLFLLVWTKRNPMKMGFSVQLARFADVLALYVPFFIVIYRVGCYFNGCCFGIRTKVPWALHYVGTNVYRHPTRIYSMISALIIFVLLKVFLGKAKTKSSKFGKRFDGEIALWFLLLYCTGRFIIDFFRVYPQHYFGLALSQWVCVGVSSLSFAILIREYCHIKKGDSLLRI